MAIDTNKSYNSRLLIILLSALLSSCSSAQPVSNTGSDSINFKIDAPVSKQHTPPSPIRISAVGDIMLGGTSEPVLQELSYNHPFEQVKHLFNDSHIVIGNLEGPLTNSDMAYADKAYLFKTPPERVAPALKQAGFTMMNLANNHIMDFGIEGLKDTMQALESNRMQHVGAGLNLAQARAGKIIESMQQKIGFLSYSLTFPESFWADKDKPGTAFGHEHQIKQDVQRMRQLTDIVIVSFHWGSEKSTELREYQPLLAHAAIDEGASMVIGHHPHVLQAVEHYKNGIILYSLGNFTFGSYSKNAESSVVATAEFRNKHFYSLRLTPINVLNVDVNFQPQVLQDEKANRVIEHINNLSSSHSTRLQNQQGIAVLQISPASIYSAAITH